MQINGGAVEYGQGIVVRRAREGVVIDAAVR